MCVISTDNCGCGSSSSGSGIGAATVTACLLVVAGLTYQVLVVAWPVLLAAEIAGLCIVYRKSPIVRAFLFASRLTIAGGIWLVRWYLRRRRKVSTEVVVPQEYQATVYQERGWGEANKVLRRGVVPGVWTSAEDVATEVRDRYIAVYGEPAGGPVKVHAQPVVTR